MLLPYRFLRHRTRVLLRQLGAVVCALAVTSCSGPAADRGPYNVLLISLDTVRQDALGVYGHKPRYAPDVSPTPTLDAFARQGAQMLQAYSTSSWTLPSHMSMLTGLSPLTHRIETESASLDPSVPTMAEVLKGHGYRTAGIYSAPYLEPHWGFARGFDRYDAVDGAAVRTVAERATAQRTAIEDAAAAKDWTRFNELKQAQVAIDRELNDRSQEAVTSAAVASAVVDQIKSFASGTQPWFMFAHFFDAHCDYIPPPPYDHRFDPGYTGSITATNCLRDESIVGHPDPNRPTEIIRTMSDRDLDHIKALYEGEVAWVDSNVATILQALDTLDLTRRTLVIITADHGEEFFEHGAIGHRRTLYEEVVRVPLLLRLPGVIPANTKVHEVASIADILPTVLDVLRLPPVSTPASSSLMPIIRVPGSDPNRGALQRLVMMIGAEVTMDTGETLGLRAIQVQDTFHRGSLKMMRARSWPQFPGNMRPQLKALLQPQAAAQFGTERNNWINLDHHPDEKEADWSMDFTDIGVNRAFTTFRAAYRTAFVQRSAASAASPIPINLRQRLESLGYVDPPSGPDYAEPDTSLPPPGFPSPPQP